MLQASKVAEEMAAPADAKPLSSPDKVHILPVLAMHFYPAQLTDI